MKTVKGTKADPLRIDPWHNLTEINWVGGVIAMIQFKADSGSVNAEPDDNHMPVAFGTFADKPTNRSRSMLAKTAVSKANGYRAGFNEPNLVEDESGQSRIFYWFADLSSKTPNPATGEVEFRVDMSTCFPTGHGEVRTRWKTWRKNFPAGATLGILARNDTEGHGEGSAGTASYGSNRYTKVFFKVRGLATPDSPITARFVVE